MTTVPKCLLEMFKQYVVVCKDFETVGPKVDDKVIWSEKQKAWLVARMKKVMNFSCSEMTEKAVEEWDASALSVALQAVTKPADVAKKAAEVRDLRNRTFHRIGAETSSDDFTGGVQTVESLIKQANTDFPNLRVWAGYLEDLDSASRSEFHSCHVMIHTVISGFLAMSQLQIVNYNQSHDYSIGLVDSELVYVVRNYMRLRFSNTDIM